MYTYMHMCTVFMYCMIGCVSHVHMQGYLTENGRVDLRRVQFILTGRLRMYSVYLYVHVLLIWPVHLSVLYMCMCVCSLYFI